MTTPDLFIGVPVFRGVGVVGETLGSIQQQTYGDLAFPAAASPAALGLFDDGRPLGLFLERIQISRA